MVQKFFRLQEALSAADLDENFYVFAKEYERGGRRYFIVCTKARFSNQSSIILVMGIEAEGEAL